MMDYIKLDTVTVSEAQLNAAGYVRRECKARSRTEELTNQYPLGGIHHVRSDGSISTVREATPEPDFTAGELFGAHRPHRWNEDVGTYTSVSAAQRAAYLMYRSNAIIKACLLVDPDYIPRWPGSTAWRVYFLHDTGRWCVASSSTCEVTVAHVSTAKKASIVAELLTMWGIK